MRQARAKGPPEAEVMYFHAMTRVVDRRFIFGDAEKDHFVKLMRGYEAFCGVRVVTYCVMGNHAHILVAVPRRPAAEELPSDQELIALVKKARYSYGAGALEQDLERFRSLGQHEAAEALRERFFSRMWDVSWFMKMLKQRFTQWYNKRNGRRGTLWEDRFKSVLVDGAGRTLATMAAYIDLNPVRARMVEDPKEYRWSGYGEAVAGRAQARAGLEVAVKAALGREQIAANRVLGEYRQVIYERGEEDGVAEAGQKRRGGFSREKVKEVLEAKGQLRTSELLRCRVRYFSDGAVIGSKEFVNGFFERNRGRFGPKRKDGARRIRQVSDQALYSLRDLRVQSVE